MWTNGIVRLYSNDGKIINEWTGTITSVASFGNGATTFFHNGNKVTVRNGIVSIVESSFELDSECDLEYPQ